MIQRHLDCLIQALLHGSESLQKNPSLRGGTKCRRGNLGKKTAKNAMKIIIF